MNVLFYTKNSFYSSKRVGGAESSIKLLAETINCIYKNENGSVTYLTTDENSNNLSVKKMNELSVFFLSEKKGFFSRYRNYDFEQSLEFILQKKKIDIVYAHYDRSFLDCLIRLRERLSFKIVLRMAGLKWYEESRSDEVVKNAYEWIFKQVDSINYNTPGLKNLVERKANDIDFNYSPRSEFVGDIGANVDPSIRKEKLSTHVIKSLRIIVATRFSLYQKRQDLLIEALAMINKQVSFEVLFVGSGPKSDLIQDMIDQNGLREQVRIVPFLSQTEVWEEMKKADVLFHPCDYEGLSKIIIESMILGLPVVASKVDPLSDYILDGSTGILVENTAEAWAEQIIALSNDSSLLFDLQKNARDYVKSAFDLKKNAKSYIVEFEKLLHYQN